MDTESRVDSYTTPLDAELAKAFLESHNIRVRLEGEDIMGAAYALGPMLGGVQLFVDKGDGERASLLLANYHRALRRPRELDKESPDKLATRAWAAAFVGFVTIPVVVHAYSVWLLSNLKRQELTPKARKRYVTAWAVNLLAFAAAGWAVVRAVG